jgi:hypothetical protein
LNLRLSARFAARFCACDNSTFRYHVFDPFSVGKIVKGYEGNRADFQGPRDYLHLLLTHASYQKRIKRVNHETRRKSLISATFGTQNMVAFSAPQSSSENLLLKYNVLTASYKDLIASCKSACFRLWGARPTQHLVVAIN